MLFCISYKLLKLLFSVSTVVVFIVLKKCDGLIIVITIILQNLFLFLNSDAHACSS